MEKGEIKISISTIKKFLGSIILFFVFTLMIGHSLNTGWIQLYFSNGTFLILIASFVIFVFFRRKSKSRLNWNLFLPLVLIFMIIFLYGIINGSIEEIEKIVYIFVSILLLFNSSLNYSDIVYIGLIMCISSVYATRGYKSFEINSLGIIFSFVIVGLINFIDLKFKKNKILDFAIISILSLLFISLTRMRGAILSVTAVSFYTIIKELDTNNKKLFSLFVIPLVLIVFWNDFTSFFRDYLFVNKWGGSDITAGRLNIWNYILKNGGIFGIGINYISNYAHAHNTILHFVGRYGYFFIPFVIYFLYVIFKTICSFPKNEIVRNSLFRVFILWLFFSITETIDFIKVSFYIPQLMLLLYLVFLCNKEILYEDKK